MTKVGKRISPESLITRSSSFLTAEMDDDLVMMSLENNAYFGLDDIGKVIWAELETPVTVQELCNRLMARYDVSAAQCFSDVTDFLIMLADEKMVDVT